MLRPPLQTYSAHGDWTGAAQLQIPTAPPLHERSS
jgi:hypothetical protein